jgi:hypothetical protein
VAEIQGVIHLVQLPYFPHVRPTRKEATTSRGICTRYNLARLFSSSMFCSM